MNEIIRVFLVDLPHAIRGFTRLNEDGSYTILINARLNAETQAQAYDHEIAHIDNGDFDSYTDVNVGQMEMERHIG